MILPWSECVVLRKWYGNMDLGNYDLNTRSEGMTLVFVRLRTIENELTNLDFHERIRSLRDLAVDPKIACLWYHPGIDKSLGRELQNMLPSYLWHQAHLVANSICLRDPDDHNDDGVDDAIKTQKRGFVFSSCRAVPTGISMHHACAEQKGSNSSQY